MTYHGEDTAQGIGGIRADRQDRRPKHHPVQLNAAAGRWALMYAASTFAQAPQPGGGDQYYPKVDSRNEISAAFRCAAVIRRSSSSSTGPCHPTRLCCSQNAPGLEERRGTSHFWDLFMAQNCFCAYFRTLVLPYLLSTFLANQNMLVAAIAASCAVAAGAPTPPNILFFLADDMG